MKTKDEILGLWDNCKDIINTRALLTEILDQRDLALSLLDDPNEKENIKECLNDFVADYKNASNLIQSFHLRSKTAAGEYSARLDLSSPIMKHYKLLQKIGVFS